VSVLAIQLALDGLAFGAVAALSGVGLIVTYQATGVLNLAHGALATLSAYLVWQAVTGWGIPVWVAGPVVVLVVAPLLGILAERLVFRGLSRRRAGVSEQLVATLGLLVAVLAVITVTWGSLPRPRVPRLFPRTTVDLPGGYLLRVDTLAELGLVALVAAALALVVTRTQLGTQVRAVVDRRDLAELAGIDADRVGAIGWATGSVLAALTGVLIAPRQSLTPYGLTLFVLETLAVVVLARLASVRVAIVSALLLGVAQEEFVQLHLSGLASQVAAALQTNFLVIALGVALALLPTLGGGRDEAGRVLADVTVGRPRLARATQLAAEAALGLALLAVPFLFDTPQLRDAQRVLALAVVFLSITVLTGYGGQISLGQAGYAGLGALLSVQFADTLPVMLAAVAAAVATGALGALSGVLAIGRRGLFLALTTLTVGVVLDRFVFEQAYFTGSLPPVERPSLVSGDDRFYLFELAVLAAVLVLVRNLRTGRSGRALAALRDSPAGARASGLDLGGTTLFVFAVSAGIAGAGGALLAQTSRSFDAAVFTPLASSLPWFTAVLFFGAGSAGGAVAAAAFLVAFDAGIGVEGASFAVAGLGVLLLSRRPGGLVGLLRRLLAGDVRESVPAPLPAVGERGWRLTPRGEAARVRLRPVQR